MKAIVAATVALGLGSQAIAQTVPPSPGDPSTSGLEGAPPEQEAGEDSLWFPNEPNFNAPPIQPGESFTEWLERGYAGDQPKEPGALESPPFPSGPVWQKIIEAPTGEYTFSPTLEGKAKHDFLKGYEKYLGTRYKTVL